MVRVGREEEGLNSLRPELAAVANTLQVTSLDIDLLSDTMKTIMVDMRERKFRGARTCGLDQGAQRKATG